MSIDITYYIPNINQFLHDINVTLPKLTYLLNHYNFSLIHNNNDIQPTAFIEINNDLNSTSNTNVYYNFACSMLLVMYTFGIFIFPFFNYNLKNYNSMFEEIKYKVLFPFLIGISFVPFLAIKYPIDFVRYLLGYIESLYDIIDNNRYKVFKNDDGNLFFYYGKIEKEFYPALYSRINFHRRQNGSINDSNSDTAETDNLIDNI